MEIGQEEHADEPTVIASHLVYFFVPLPDLLGVPDEQVFTVLEDTPPDRNQDETALQICIGASLCFRRVELPTAQAEELILLFDLASQSLRSPPNAKSRASKTEDSSPEPDTIAPPVHATTVVEMAVSVELPEVDESMSEEELSIQLSDQLTEAFDRGLHYVRQFQRAYYLMRREPIRLVTRESLPFAVPYGIRELFDDEGQPLPFDVPLSIYLVNMNIPTMDLNSWDDHDSAALRTAVAHQADDGPFASFPDLVRESNVALVRDGAYRSAVLFAATACEVLFDELLAHMMWEEGARPEDSAVVFDSKLTPRVKSQYHGRLGGQWNPNTEGPIGDWTRLVARLRNRVVHGGHEPTFQEATAAVAATTELTEHLGGLVAGRAETYPRTALVLPGEGGLRSRGRWTSALNDLRNEPSELQWTRTFSRWRLAMQRAKKNSPLAEVPSESNANVYVVVRKSGAEQWVVHDTQAGMAAVVTDPADITGVSPEQLASVQELIQFLAEQSERTDVSVSFGGAKVRSIPAGSWVPEYRLIPEAGVMVTGKDLDPP